MPKDQPKFWKPKPGEKYKFRLLPPWGDPQDFTQYWVPVKDRRNRTRKPTWP